MANGIRLRPFADADLDAIFTISLLTGLAGGDATALHEDPRLIGEIYSAPYAKLEPDFAFVAEDELGTAGYIVGTPDTRAFEARLEREWWPPLRSRHADPSAIPVERWTADQLRAYQIHYPRPAASDIVAAFPAHLHMNLHPRLQGLGVGPRLLQLWLDGARKRCVTGVHLGSNHDNTRAIRFWSRNGFERIDRPATPRSSVWFGCRLAA